MTLTRLLGCLLLLSACSAGAQGDEGATLRVVTTVAPLTSIVASVGGDRVTVTGLVPEGTNSHTFEPPPSAAEALSRADVIVINGLKLEDPTAELAQENKKDGTPVVELGTTVLPKDEYIFDFSFPEEDGKPNPHLWTDPLWAIRYAEVAAKALTEADPDGASVYADNLEAFRVKATALSDALKTDQATIPGKRQLLTYHDAYAYFAKDYGWEVVGAVQPKSFEDPTAKDVIALIEQIRAQKVPVIFGSEVFPSRILEQIGKETGARYESTLRDDDLPGKPGDAEHSWLGLMRYDYRTMIKGLGGTTSTLDALDISAAVPDSASYPQ